MDHRLWAVAQEIATQTAELEAREALLQDHMRSAYEQSQISLLEIILHASNLDEATNQVGYLLTMSDQDQALADEIRVLREELLVKQQTLSDGRAALREARMAAAAERKRLVERKAQLQDARAAGGQAEGRGREEASRPGRRRSTRRSKAKGNVKQQIAANEKAFEQANQLVHRLVADQRAIEEARRLADRAARDQANKVSAQGFRWPEVGARVTQEWGPTNFVLEPAYTYHGVYYPHFHGGIDMANGCGTPILASASGRVGASGPAAVAVGPGLRRGDQPRRRRPELVLAPASPGHRPPRPGGEHRPDDRLRGEHRQLDRLPPPLRDQRSRHLGEPAGLPAVGRAASGRDGRSLRGCTAGR